MEVDIESALREGVRRTVARNGLLLVGIVYVLGVVSGLFGPRRPAGAMPGGGPGPAAGLGDIGAAVQPVVPVSPVLAGLIGFVFSLASIVVTIGALRVFLGDETERLPTEVFTRRIGWTFLNFLVGAIVFGIAVGIGFVLLVVPGIFLMVSLAFWTVYVVEEDENFFDGFRRSWSLTSGHRLRLFALGLVVLVLTFLVSALFGAVGAFLGSVVRVLGVVVAQVGNAFTTVFVSATLAAAYKQLQGQGTADTIGGLTG
jgi:hypothetical protein